MQKAEIKHLKLVLNFIDSLTKTIYRSFYTVCIISKTKVRKLL